MSFDRSRWTPQYYQRVLATDPIAHWMQDEKQGLVSYDMVTARSDGARNGQYTGPTLGQPGIGDGRTSAQFDGALDYNNIHTASLQAAFNPLEGSMAIWFRVANAGVWTDGASRYMMSIGVNAANQIQLQRTPANGTIRAIYAAGGVTDPVVTAGLSSTDYQSYIATWSVGADAFIVYLNGAPIGSRNTLGVWVGNLSAGRTVIGALTTAPLNVWDGTLAHGILWGYPLSPAQAFSLGVL